MVAPHRHAPVQVAKLAVPVADLAVAAGESAVTDGDFGLHLGEVGLQALNLALLLLDEPRVATKLVATPTGTCLDHDAGVASSGMTDGVGVNVLVIRPAVDNNGLHAGCADARSQDFGVVYLLHRHLTHAVGAMLVRRTVATASKSAAGGEDERERSE